MIHFVSYDSEFCLNCGLYTEGVFSRKCDNDSNSEYIRKWKTRHYLENGQGL